MTRHSGPRTIWTSPSKVHLLRLQRLVGVLRSPKPLCKTLWIVSHRRGRGRNNILLTVKYVDRPLGFHPAELSASDARRLSPDLVDSYLTRRRLQQAKGGGCVAATLAITLDSNPSC